MMVAVGNGAQGGGGVCPWRANPRLHRMEMVQDSASLTWSARRWRFIPLHGGCKTAPVRDWFIIAPVGDGAQGG